MAKFTTSEMDRIQAYLQTTFSNEKIFVKARDKISDSIEVLLNGEHIAVIYKDEDEGETSYDLQMAILEMDLPKTA
jgi:hypothetical protein